LCPNFRGITAPPTTNNQKRACKTRKQSTLATDPGGYKYKAKTQGKAKLTSQ